MSFTGDVFTTIAERLETRGADIALFLESPSSFEQWCIWEAYAACRERGWSATANPAYRDAGLPGARESAGLLLFDPEHGHRLLVELAVVHDWTTNRWIAHLNEHTTNLGRPLTSGVTPLQVILAASLASPILVNQQWATWLGMARIWDRPTKLEATIGIGTGGQGLLRGWDAKQISSA